MYDHLNSLSAAFQSLSGLDDKDEFQEQLLIFLKDANILLCKLNEMMITENARNWFCVSTNNKHFEKLENITSHVYRHQTKSFIYKKNETFYFKDFLDDGTDNRISILEYCSSIFDQIHTLFKEAIKLKYI